MPYVLNHYRTQSEYTDSGTLKCPLAIGANLYVSNAGIYYQMTPEDEMRGEAWEQEAFLKPGRYFFGRALSSVRVRSAVEFVNAIVTIEAIKNYEG